MQDPLTGHVAVNTCPRARKLTASMRPATAVRPNRTPAKTGVGGDDASMTRSVAERRFTDPGSFLSIQNQALVPTLSVPLADTIAKAGARP